MSGLRTRFTNNYPKFAVSGLYQGYMDMTYFAIFPQALKERSLKIAIVFNCDSFRFEAWLAASNRKIRRRYWEPFEDSQWPNCRVVVPAKSIDSIIKCNLTDFWRRGIMSSPFPGSSVPSDREYAGHELLRPSLLTRRTRRAILSIVSRGEPDVGTDLDRRFEQDAGNTQRCRCRSAKDCTCERTEAVGA